MKCLNCKFDNLAFEKTCINCGAPLKTPSEKIKAQPNQFIWIILGIIGIFLVIFFYISGIISPKSESRASINKLNNQQAAALDKLAQASSEQVQYFSQDGIIRYAAMQVPVANADRTDPQSVAMGFLIQHSDLLQIDDIANQLIAFSKYATYNGTLVHFNQVYQGIPVFASDLIVEVDNQGNALSIHGSYTSNLDFSIEPKLTSDEAFYSAVKDAELKNPSINTVGNLVIYDVKRMDGSERGKPVLAWLINIRSDDATGNYIIDAEKGSILTFSPSFVSIDENIPFFDANGKTTDEIAATPDNFQSISDQTVETQNLKKNLQIVKDYYSMLEDDGLRGFELNIRVYINISSDQCKKNSMGAYSRSENGIDYLFICKNSSDSLDTIAHEYAHLVSNKFNGPSFYSPNNAESGALDESYSDIFAAFIANFQNNTNAEKNNPWLISFGNNGSNPIRKISERTFDFSKFTFKNSLNYKQMAKPNVGFPFTACSKEEFNTYGCSHANSTIHSNAIYKLVNKIDFYKTERIFYHILANGYIFPDARFSDARTSAYSACIDLMRRKWFGISQNDCDEINIAFDSVGIPYTIYAPFTKTIETPQSLFEEPEDETINNVQNGQIVFVNSGLYFEYEYFIMDGDGKNLKQIPSPNIQPWEGNSSGEMRKIVFSISEGEPHECLGDDDYCTIRAQTSEIYIINLDGAGLTRLTNNDFEDDWPFWSPDGKTIGFISNRDGKREIYSMNADGSNLRQLSKTESELVLFDWAWAPNSNKLLFLTSDAENRQLNIVNSDGSDLVPISDPMLKQLGNTVEWSPDSQKIAYLIQSRGDSIGVIEIISEDGRNSKPFSRIIGKQKICYFEWFPDSQNILYVSYDGFTGGNNEIIISSLDGKEQEIILSSPLLKNFWDAQLSPDGKKILYSLGNEIWSINTDGSDLKKLIDRDVLKEIYGSKYYDDGGISIVDWLPQ